MTKKEALAKLASDYGYDSSFEMLDDYAFESLVPSVCVECGYTTDYEPDQDGGWCEVCEKNTVKSLLVLEGII